MGHEDDTGDRQLPGALGVSDGGTPPGHCGDLGPRQWVSPREAVSLLTGEGPRPEPVVLAADDLEGAGTLLAQLRVAGLGDAVTCVVLSRAAVLQTVQTLRQLQKAIDNIPAPIFCKDADAACTARVTRRSRTSWVWPGRRSSGVPCTTCGRRSWPPYTPRPTGPCSRPVVARSTTRRSSTPTGRCTTSPSTKACSSTITATRKGCPARSSTSPSVGPSRPSSSCWPTPTRSPESPTGRCSPASSTRRRPATEATGGWPCCSSTSTISSSSTTPSATTWVTSCWSW